MFSIAAAIAKFVAWHSLVAQESLIELTTPTGTLHGTLKLPVGARQPMPVALIIAGSGPTDRDGNSPLLPGLNNSLKMVADALAANGVASVRYDKRGVAASMGAASKESDLRFAHYVNDATLWLQDLATDKRFKDLIVVGHSEGSLIGIMAAQRAPVARVISLAGAGRPVTAVLEEQLRKQIGSGPLLDDALRILKALAEGRTVDTVPPMLLSLYRPSVQPYLISWITIDPAEEVARLKVPVLVVQGSTDVQTALTDAERLAKANPKTQLEVIDGMNHVLKEVRDESKQMDSYGNPSLPLHPGLVEAIGRFLKASARGER
jgi:uncharacterized protein